MDWRLRRWSLWFLALSNAPRLPYFPTSWLCRRQGLHRVSSLSSRSKRHQACWSYIVTRLCYLHCASLCLAMHWKVERMGNFHLSDLQWYVQHCIYFQGDIGKSTKRKYMSLFQIKWEVLHYTEHEHDALEWVWEHFSGFGHLFPLKISLDENFLLKLCKYRFFLS